MRRNVKQVLCKALTVLLRATIIFFGFPPLIHFYKHTLPDLMRSNPTLANSILFASVLLLMILNLMILNSMIDRDDNSNQVLTNERGN